MKIMKTKKFESILRKASQLTMEQTAELAEVLAGNVQDFKGYSESRALQAANFSLVAASFALESVADENA